MESGDSRKRHKCIWNEKATQRLTTKHEVLNDPARSVMCSRQPARGAAGAGRIRLLTRRSLTTCGLRLSAQIRTDAAAHPNEVSSTETIVRISRGIRVPVSVRNRQCILRRSMLPQGSVFFASSIRVSPSPFVSTVPRLHILWLVLYDVFENTRSGVARRGALRAARTEKVLFWVRTVHDMHWEKGASSAR
jgi:hypothetical protein